MVNNMQRSFVLFKKNQMTVQDHLDDCSNDKKPDHQINRHGDLEIPKPSGGIITQQTAHRIHQFPLR